MYLYTPAFRLIDIDETTHFLPMAPLGSVGQEYSLFARWLKVSANDQCKIMSMAGVPRGGGAIGGPYGCVPPRGRYRWYWGIAADEEVTPCGITSHRGCITRRESINSTLGAGWHGNFNVVRKDDQTGAVCKCPGALYFQLPLTIYWVIWPWSGAHISI